MIDHLMAIALDGWLPFALESAKPLLRPDLMIRRSVVKILDVTF